MCTETCSIDFWSNFIPQVLVAAGTIGAVIVALYGEQIKAKWFAPKLKISLLNSDGRVTPVTLIDPINNIPRKEDGRYYYISVWNEKRNLSTAHQVQVFLTRLEKKDATGEYKVEWDGEIPLRWEHQEIYPLSRTIGYPINIDMCSVVKNKWVEILR